MKPSKRRRRRDRASASSHRRTEPAPSAVTVASDDDLLARILLFLPFRSLLHSQLVSKRWLSLITDPYFSRCRRRLQFPNPPLSGMFIHSFFLSYNPEHDGFDSPICGRNPLNPLSKALSLIDNPASMELRQSCNGLLLFSSLNYVSDTDSIQLNLYIFNPTTQQFIPLPELLGVDSSIDKYDVAVHGIALAFDPAKSSNYKVVCLRRVNQSPNPLYRIEVYSSETGHWRVSGEPFPSNNPLYFNYGVFCNGSVHWGVGKGVSLYFNVDEEVVRTLLMPSRTGTISEGHWISYFGVSRGHLHLIDMYNDTWTWFNVYEMKADCSGWFVKYRVDLGPIVTAYPFMAYSWSGLRHHALGVLEVVRGLKEEESYLVMYIEGKLIRYNFATQSFDELCDFNPNPDGEEDVCLVKYGCQFSAFPFIEYLSL